MEATKEPPVNTKPDAGFGTRNQNQGGQHDQSKIVNDGWSKEKLEKDQSGNDALIKILEDALKDNPPPPAPAKSEDE